MQYGVIKKIIVIVFFVLLIFSSTVSQAINLTKNEEKSALDVKNSGEESSPITGSSSDLRIEDFTGGIGLSL